MSSARQEHTWEDPGVFPVLDGVYRIPLPLPGDGLKAVNVYVVEQRDGTVLIDSGWALGRAQQMLEERLAEIGHDLGSIRRILVTHVHRDHYELGLHVRRLTGSRVDLGEGERVSLREMVDDVTWEDSALIGHLRRAGAAALIDDIVRARRKRLEAGDLDVPKWEYPDHWLRDGEIVDLEGLRLEVIATPGHTRGHVVFFERESGVLFSGDHVLPHITPSIGFEQVPPESALGDYLASLALVRSLPDARLLPAHGPVRPTTHDRVDELIAHHDHRLRASLDAVGGKEVTAFGVAQRLPWTRRNRSFADLDPFNQMLAVNETAAHLDVLVRRDDLQVHESQDVRYYAA